MTSKERVRTVFNHEEPDRVPCWFGTSPEFWEKAKGALSLDDEGLRLRLRDDFCRVMSRYAGPVERLNPGAVYVTPFGSERFGVGYGQPTEHPLAEANLKELHDYAWPDPEWIDVSHIRDEAARHSADFAILGGEWAPFWHDAIDLIGMENLYYKMYDDPEFVDALMTHIVDYYFDGSVRTFDSAADLIDIFFIGNDFGSQTGPLVGEELFRRFLLPHLKRLIDLGHDYDLPSMMHCCGGFKPLIPSMIEVGLDGLHALQPTCHDMDLPILKEEFGDRIVLNGGVDSHHVLIEGTVDLVRQKTREAIDTMKPGGGCILSPSHDYVLEETPLKNVLAMYDTIYEYGRY
jgi:uroporphyrinogen decarboxylase